MVRPSRKKHLAVCWQGCGVGAGFLELTGIFMSGTAINPPGGVCGSEVGKGWKHSDIRVARPSHLDLVRKKMDPFVALIAFLLHVMMTFHVLFLVAGLTITCIVL